jgi:hypothetical protein
MKKLLTIFFVLVLAGSALANPNIDCCCFVASETPSVQITDMTDINSPSVVQAFTTTGVVARQQVSKYRYYQNFTPTQGHYYEYICKQTSAGKEASGSISQYETYIDASIASRGTSTYAGGAVASVTGAVGSVGSSVTCGTVSDKTGYTVSIVQDKTGYTASTVSDKTGYSLASTQTFNTTGNITGNVSGSVGSVTAGVTVSTNNDKTGYALIVTPPTAAQVSTQVWTEALPGSFGSGSAGKLLSLAGAAADPWDVTAGSYGAGKFGKIVYDNLNATVSSRLALASYTAPDNSSITAIKTKTDNLPSDPASNTQVNTRASQTSVNSIPTNPTLQTTWTDAKAGYITGIVALDSTVAKSATVALDSTVAKQATLTTLIPEAIPFTSHKIDANATATVDNAAIADAVWDETLSGHLGSGSTGANLQSASSSADPWSTSLPGGYSAGTAGHKIGTYIDAKVSDALASVNALPTLTQIEASTKILQKTSGSTTNQISVTADNKVSSDATINSSDMTTIAQRTWNNTYASTRKLTSPFTDESSSRDMSATGAVTGSSQVNLLVYKTGTTTPISQVMITVQDSGQTVTQGSIMSNANGIAVTALNDLTYKLLLNKSGYTFTVPETLVVSGTTSKILYGDEIVIGTPGTAKTCRVYEYLFNQDDATKPTTVIATAQIRDLPYDYNGRIHKGDKVPGTYNSSTGVIYWDLVWGARVTFVIQVFDKQTGSTGTVPLLPQERLKNILDTQ